MRAPRTALAILSVLVHAACSAEPATRTTFDLIVHDVQPGQLDFTAAATSSLMLRAQNVCARPVLLLDGVPFPDPFFVGPAGIRLPGGRHLVDTFFAAHPEARDACAFASDVRLAIDCAGQIPGYGIPASVERPGYGIASGSAAVRLTLATRAPVEPWPVVEALSPAFPIGFVVAGRLDDVDGKALLDGEAAAVRLVHAPDPERTFVLLNPWSRLRPGPHVAVLPGGPAGVRLADGQCLDDGGVTVPFTIRGEEEPDLRLWIERSPERKLRWEDFGPLIRYDAYGGPEDDVEHALGITADGATELPLHEGQGPCFRVRAIVANAVLPNSPVIAESAVVCEEP